MAKKMRSKQAVSEVLGIVVLLGITIALFGLLNYIVFSFSFETPAPSVNLIGSMDGKIIILEHNGGESLDGNTDVIITIDNTPYQKSVRDLINDTNSGDEWEFEKINNDYKWNFGETIKFTSSGSTTSYIRAIVRDPSTNTLMLSVVLQEGK